MKKMCIVPIPVGTIMQAVYPQSLVFIDKDLRAMRLSPRENPCTFIIARMNMSRRPTDAINMLPCKLSKLIPGIFTGYGLSLVQRIISIVLFYISNSVIHTHEIFSDEYY